MEYGTRPEFEPSADCTLDAEYTIADVTLVTNDYNEYTLKFMASRELSKDEIKRTLELIKQLV